MTHSYKWLQLGALMIFLCSCWQSSLEAQARIQVRVVSIQVTNSCDLDSGFLGIGDSDSDFVVHFEGQDNTLGFTNHDPVNSLLGYDYNYVYNNNNNGPWTVTPANTGNFNNNTNLFFDHEYNCPADVPTQITIDWEGYENDNVTNFAPFGGLDRDAETGMQSITIPVPPVGGPAIQGSGTATGSDGCTQTFNVTFEVTALPLAVNYWPDAVCNAIQIPVGGSETRAYCPATLEPNEPSQGDINANGSVWFYFQAPASGRVDISTDNGGTDFGTEIHIYHAADGVGCTAGLQIPSLTLIKDKFEYLSSVDRADLGGFLNLEVEADITFDDCAGILSSNPLVAGEIYYVQMSVDDGNDRGFIEVSVSDLGGSPAEPYDIPCQATDVTATAQSTTVRTFANGQPESANLTFGCATGRETGNPHTSNNPDQYQAYDYDHPATNNGTIHESLWTRFTAPNSGRIYFEGAVEGLFGLNETENTALFGYDPRFAPGVPADYLCANLSNIDAAEGGTGILGANETAIITQQCLEPGYDYFAMVDPSGAATGDDTYFWLYDPSTADPTDNPPGNDILCLTLNDPLYEIPVQQIGQPPLPFQAVAGTNERACIETLAGEPVAAPAPADRADQTVWHYFTVPPSGVVEIQLRAYIGLNQLRYAIYPLLNGATCYGGLAPATYTDDGTRLGNALTPIAQGITDFNGTTIGLCCLTPGERYAVQLDGGSPGDVGQYIIEYIDEIEVYAGDSQFETQAGDTVAYNSNDTALVCFGDSIFPSVMLNPLGVTTTNIPGCQDVGFMMHNTLPLPDPIANVGFTYIDTTRAVDPFFVNNTNNSGSFGNPLFNQVYYVSALADEDATWGDLTCPSASSENGAAVVFLRPIFVTDNYDPNNCIITFTASGGAPAYNGSLFNWVATNTSGDTITGTAANGVPVLLPIPIADTYTIEITDQTGCGQVVVVNATLCNNPCITDPVRITPSPIDSSVYTCLPGGDSATVTLSIDGGYPASNSSAYTVTVSGSTAAGANGTFNLSGPTPATYSFTVRDGDTWTVVVADSSLCSDTATATFTYDLTNCPDFCTLNPLLAGSNYNCFSNGSALVEIAMTGGQPSIDGSNYSVTVSGSTVFGQTFNNAQVPGTIGGSSSLSFLVNDGDSWTAIIIDDNGCSDTLNDTYIFNSTNCPNLCQLLPVVITPNPADSTVYTCNPDGTADVTLAFGGGDPVLNGTSYTVEVIGSSVAGQSGVFSTGIGNYNFTVDDGDNWQVIITDVNNCADTVSGTFTYDASNCDVCLLFPLELNGPAYSCNSDGTATVDVTISGGLPSVDGSNYTLTVTGSSAGGNVSNIPVAGSIGNSVTYSFLVDDGDSWQVDVFDAAGCQDSLLGTFIYNSSNCPDLCDSFPIVVIDTGYACNLDGTADVTLFISGGQPSFDGSDYLVTVTGLSTGNNSFNLPIPGTIGGTTTYTFTVGDGDIWQAFITDTEGCSGSSIDTFTWNATNCGNICEDPSYTNVLINGGFDTVSYDCDGNGSAILNLELSGGLPAISTLSNAYTATVSINGNNTTQQITSNGNFATLSLTLNDGDVWQVIVTDALGCSDDTIAATFTAVNAVAETDAGFEIMVGEEAVLIGSNSTGNITSYLWTPPADIIDPTAATTSTFPVFTTTYTLQVSDDNDCSDIDSVEVRVGECVPDHAGFTPNNDGTNDTWQIPCLNLLDGDLEVYNRWGQLVYAQELYDGSWDGTHFQTNQNLPDATYYYILKVTYPGFNEPIIYKGTVTIIR